MAAAFVAIGTAARPPRRSTRPIAPRSSRSTSPTSDAKALVVEDRRRTRRLVGIAEENGVPVVELIPTPMDPPERVHAERLHDQGEAQHNPVPPADDIALVLHTSGTTSRPKIVPLSHANVCASARQHPRRRSQLTAADRCLNIMPLFHIHGLIAAVLASLKAPAHRIYCTPGFNAIRFFAWMRKAAPELVYGGADHAPGDPRPRRRATRRGRKASGAAASFALHRRRCRLRS